MSFRAWLQRRVGLEPTPTLFPQPQDVANAVLYGCPFWHGYKEGSVWNRPLHYFLNHGTPTPTPDEKPNPPIYLQFYLSTQTDLRIDNRKNLFPGESSIAGFHHSIMSFIFDDAPSDGSGNKLQIALPGCLRNEIPIFSPV